MKKMALTSFLILVFIGTSFAQLPHTSGDLWFNKIGQEYSYISGTAYKSQKPGERFVDNGQGVLINIMDRINPISHKFISYRIAGFRFYSPKEVIRFNLNAKENRLPDNLTPYVNQLPLGLKWGMTQTEVKEIWPAMGISAEANPEGYIVGNLLQLPGFPNLNVLVNFRDQELSRIFITWRDGWNNTKNFWRPDNLIIYNLEEGMNEKERLDKLLDIDKMYHYLDVIFNISQGLIKGYEYLGLHGTETKYEEVNGEGRRINTYCTNEQYFKFSYFNGLNATLDQLLSDCLVPQSQKNYKIFEAYQSRFEENSFEEERGEIFYYHKDDANDFRKVNKWPVFHIYTFAGTNEVVFEVIPPNLANTEKQEKNIFPSAFSNLKGNNWLWYIEKDELNLQADELLNYLRSFLAPGSYDSDHWVEVKPFGITVYTDKVKRKKKYIKKITAIELDSNYKGELPLGYSFNQKFDELKGSAKPNGENKLRLSINKDIRVDFEFNEKGEMISFYVDHFADTGITDDWETAIEKFNSTSHNLPSVNEVKEYNRFEMKFQKACKPDNLSLVFDRTEYIHSLKLDLSNAINPAVANVTGGETLSAINRPIEGECARILIAKLGNHTDNPFMKNFGSLDFENTIITYRIDSIFEDLRIIKSIEFKKGQLQDAPLGLTQNLSKGKVRKLFPTDAWTNIEDASVIENYKGYRFSFRYDGSKLNSLTISLPEN
ncbi:MAG: hypothetical protein RIF33_02135 [Cyclobacteriaceae bacterium]